MKMWCESPQAPISKGRVEVKDGINPGDSIVISDMTEYANKKNLKIKQ